MRLRQQGSVSRNSHYVGAKAPTHNEMALRLSSGVA
jgi:hypothetical protein